MIDSFPSPIYFAHRGSSAHAPENTLAAFELAVKQGAPAIEFDVKLTADRKVIIHHDPTLDRTTNGHGPVSSKTLAELRALDAGSSFSTDFKGEKIPTLDEVFEAVGKKLLINVELTNYATPFDGLVGEVAEVVRRHNIQNRIIFSSFSFSNLVAARRLLPEVPRGQLFLEGYNLWQRFVASLMSLDAEHPYLEDVTAEMVERQHSKKRRVHVWTVNSPEDMRRLRGMGVDGIFTDDPLLAREHFCC